MRVPRLCSRRLASVETPTAALPARDLVSSPETTILSGEWAYAASERRPRIGVAEKVAPPAKPLCSVDEFDPSTRAVGISI